MYILLRNVWVATEASSEKHSNKFCKRNSRWVIPFVFFLLFFLGKDN
jgi:hypothetical protein